MKIDRALIIRRKTVELSIKYAETCIESCEQHGLPYEVIDAIDFLECDQAFAKVGVKKQPGYHNHMGNCGCHASHIKCWKRIIDLNKPCIILEHDAIVKGNVRNIDIPDMAVVTFGHRVARVDDYDPIGPCEKLIQINKAVGVHACALTPQTAKWLVADAETNGIGIGVDRWLIMERKSGLPLYVADPPQVVCWVRTSTSKFSNPNQSEAPHKRRVVNIHEALSPAWHKGIKK